MAILTYTPYTSIRTYFNPRLGTTRTSSSYKVVKDNRFVNPATSKRVRPKSIFFSPTARTVEVMSYNDFPRLLLSRENNGAPNGTMFTHSEALSGNMTRPGIGAGTSFISKPIKGNELLLKIKEEKINMGMLLAEYRQTAQMFVASAYRLAQFYRQLRKGNVNGMVASASQYVRRKTYRDDWMLYRYGITPFVMDAEAIFKLLHEGLTKELVKRFTVYEGKDSRIETVWGGTTNRSLRMRHLYQTSAKQTAWVEYESSILGGLSQVGLLNPAQLAWEVVPFSFVADWFVNIGDMLSSLDALTGVKRIAITRNQRMRCFTTYSYVWDRHITPFEPAYARRDTRSVLAPGQLRSLNWDPSLSWKRIVDSVALISQNKPRIRL